MLWKASFLWGVQIVFLFRLHNSCHVWLKLSCWLLQAQEFFLPLGVKITSQSLSCLLDDVAPAAAVYRVFFSLFLFVCSYGSFYISGCGWCWGWDYVFSEKFLSALRLFIVIQSFCRKQRCWEYKVLVAIHRSNINNIIAIPKLQDLSIIISTLSS